MRDSTIARNYAEVLVALARRADALDAFGEHIAAVASAMESEPRLGSFLAAPQVSADQKKAVLARAFAAYPRPFLRFLQKLVENRRQLLIPAVAVEYANLVDESTGRVHAQVTVSREATEKDRASIAAALTKRMGRTVIPHVIVNPAILGGVIVRVGDTVMDGSVRKRVATLRSQLTQATRR